MPSYLQRLRAPIGNREDAMTDQITTTGPARGSTAARRTRRQLLAGGTGALAAVLTAEALARPGLRRHRR